MAWSCPELKCGHPETSLDSITKSLNGFGQHFVPSKPQLPRIYIKDTNPQASLPISQVQVYTQPSVQVPSPEGMQCYFA